MVVHGAISDKLDLLDTRNRLEVWVEDGLLLALGLLVPVAVALRRGVERLRLDVKKVISVIRENVDVPL